jgi:integrase
VRRVVARGKPYVYFQRGRSTARAGKPIRLPDDVDSAEFWAAYAAAANLPLPQPRPNAVGLLIDAYQQSPEWKDLADKTREEWTRYLDRVRQRWGHLEVRGIEPKHVLALRDTYASTPASANNLLRALSSMLSWSVPRGWRTDNPCDHVKKLKGGEGYAPWSRREIAHFGKHARSDLWHSAALALYTGQRQGDVVVMRRSSIRDGEIEVVQHKTGKRVWIPLHPDLKAILAEMPKRSVFLLTNSVGTPWTQDGFRASWQAEMDRRIFKPLRRRRRVFHGLRKSAVVFLLEAGCTDAQVAAITGQSRQMIEHYARQVNQRKLARAAVLKWGRADRRTRNEPGR